MWSQLEIGSMQAGIDLENRTQVLSSFAGDMEEAMAAFLEKRPPRFSDGGNGVTGVLDGRAALDHRRRAGDRPGDRARARDRRCRRRRSATARRGRRPGRPSPTSRRSAAGPRRSARRSTTRSRPRRWRQAVLDEFGPVDVLVHNAGIASRGADVAHTEVAEVERLFRTHALAALRAVQAPAPADARPGPGRRRHDLERRDLAPGRELGAVQHGEGRARGTGDGRWPRRSGATAST